MCGPVYFLRRVLWLWLFSCHRDRLTVTATQWNCPSSRVWYFSLHHQLQSVFSVSSGPHVTWLVRFAFVEATACFFNRIEERANWGISSPHGMSMWSSAIVKTNLSCLYVVGPEKLPLFGYFLIIAVTDQWFDKSCIPSFIVLNPCLNSGHFVVLWVNNIQSHVKMPHDFNSKTGDQEVKLRQLMEHTVITLPHQIEFQMCYFTGQNLCNYLTGQNLLPHRSESITSQVRIYYLTGQNLLCNRSESVTSQVRI